jgi:O-antigen/teichoic acid export membrane protein
MNIRQSLVLSYLDRYASLLVNIGMSMAIARLLTPEDIGTYSVTMVLLAFINIVRDMGAGDYLIQEKELTVERVRAVWAVQLGLGLLLALLVLIASVPVAWFYHEPRMRDIMAVIALNYAINPFGSLTYAWQIREMRFDTLALVRFSATMTGAAVSIVLAWQGHGPISLAIGQLAATIISALMNTWYRPSWFPWMPGLKEVRRVLAFGVQSTGAGLISTIAANAPELLLGKLQSMTVTGLYSRASGLVQMFDRLVLAGISSVAMSWFARQAREHGSIAAPFLKATSYVTAIGFAFAFSLALLAYPIMRILYGAQWDGAVDVTRLLALALAFSLPSALCVPALMAVGDVGRVLRCTAIATVGSVALVALGATQGLVALGSCLLAASVLRSGYWLAVTRGPAQFEWVEMWRVVCQSALVGIGAAVGPAAAFIVFGARPVNVWGSLAIGATTSLAGLVLTIVATRHPLLHELRRMNEKLGWPRVG